MRGTIVMLAGFLAVASLCAVAAGRPVSGSDIDGLRTDTILCGDYNTDGQMDELDINQCIDELPESGGVVQLVAGTYRIDLNQDGFGDFTCENGNPRFPHICLKSDTHLIGQGVGVTVLQLEDNTGNACKLGRAPIIGVDSDGSTETRATTGLVSGLYIADLTLQTDPDNNNDGCETCSNGQAYGVALWDVVGALVERVECRDLNHACVHMNRAIDSWGKDSFAYHVGGYDFDREGTACQTLTAQAAFYMYSTDGFVSMDNGYENCEVEGTGGFGFNIRSNSWAERSGPLGEDALSFARRRQRIAQQFEQEDLAGKVSGLAVYLRADPTATGSLTTRIETVSAGQPSGVPVPNCDHADFETLDVSELPPTFAATRIRHLDNIANLCSLAPGGEYALVMTYDNAQTQPDLVALQFDDSGSEDTYDECDDCDVRQWDGMGWLVKLDRDLNFHIENGRIVRPIVSGGIVRDATGKNGRGAACVRISAAIDPDVSVQCENTGGILMGASHLTIGGSVHDFSVTDTAGNVSDIASGIRIGPMLAGLTLSDGQIAGTPLGSSCIFFNRWVRGMQVNDVVMRDCGENGVLFHEGNRDISFTGGGIFGTQEDGFQFYRREHEDGVFGGMTNIAVRGMTIAGVSLNALAGGSSSSWVKGLSVRENSFLNTGKSVLLARQFDCDGEDCAFEDVAFTDNYIAGWGENGVGIERSALRLEGGFRKIKIARNLIESFADNEDRAIYYRTDQDASSGATADHVHIEENIFLGSVLSTHLIEGQTNPGDTIVVRNNNLLFGGLRPGSGGLFGRRRMKGLPDFPGKPATTRTRSGAR